MKNFSSRLIQLCLSIACITTIPAQNIATAKPETDINKNQTEILTKEIESLKRDIQDLKEKDKKFIETQDFGPWPSEWFPNLTGGSAVFSILISLAAAGAGTYIILLIDNKHSLSTKNISKSLSGLRQNLGSQSLEIRNLSLKIDSYSQNIDGLRQEWKADIRQSQPASSTSASNSPSDWSTAYITGDAMNLPPSFRQTDTAQAVSLQEQIKREFGKSSTYFTSDRFQPMRARNAWQGVVNSEGVSALELEDCQTAEASYLRFSDANQDYLIPNATNPRLRQQILQLEQENSSAFQIRVSPTGELKLHQAAKITRNGADSWSVIEPGLIER